MNDQNTTNQNQNWNQLYWRSMFTYKALVYIAVSVLLKNRLLAMNKENKQWMNNLKVNTEQRVVEDKSMDK